MIMKDLVNNREFFRCNLETIKEAMNKAVNYINYNDTKYHL